MNGNIYDLTLGKVLGIPQAKALFEREFPHLTGSPLIRLYSSVRLGQILSISKGKVPEEKINRIKKELEAIIK